MSISHGHLVRLSIVPIWSGNARYEHLPESVALVRTQLIVVHEFGFVEVMNRRNSS